ncbi:MAG: cold shock domain-containing protein [Chitinophagales bacterium]
MNKGILIELNHGFGYGYIKCSKSGKDLFCKFEDIEYELPKENDLVSFDLIEGNNSELAININLLEKMDAGASNRVSA